MTYRGSGLPVLLPALSGKAVATRDKDRDAVRGSRGQIEVLDVGETVAGGKHVVVPHVLDGTLEHTFMDWMKQHGKVYENTEDMLHRMEIWMDNHGM